MFRHAFGATVAVVCLVGSPSPGRAEETAPGIGPPGSLVIGVERLFGASHTHTSVDLGGITSSGSSLHLSVLGTVEPIDRDAVLVYTHPRLSVDVALPRRFTLGGSVGFGYSRRSSDATGGEGPTQLSLVLTPRAGYALAFGAWALWLRGGLSYFHQSDPDITVWGLAATIEPTLVLFPVEWLGFSVGAVIDLPLAGRRTFEAQMQTVRNDVSLRQLGVMAGVLGRL